MMNEIQRWVKCDKCGRGGPCRDTSYEARQAARDEGWVVNVRRDVCPECEEK